MQSIERRGWRLLGLAALVASWGCAPSTSSVEPEPAPHPGQGGQQFLPLATPCAFAGSTASMSLNAGESALLALDVGGAFTVNGVACGTATGATLQRVSVTVANLASVSDETIIIDGSNGLFAPGFSGGVGITVNLGSGTGDSVQVLGTAGDDVLIAGRSSTDLWLAWNHDLYRDMTFVAVESLTVGGGAGNDTLSASGVTTAWTSGTYYTTSLPVNVPVTMQGGLGNDTLVGGVGNTTYAGGGGSDTVSYAARTGPVLVTIGDGANDGIGAEVDDVQADIAVVVGTPQDDHLECLPTGGCTLYGGAGNDTLLGHAGNDRLYGEAGDDLLSPGAGSDVVNGGPGHNTVTYADATPDGGVTVTLGTFGTPTTGNGHAGENDTLDYVENVVGSPQDDVITGNALDNRITGGLGNDTLSGGAGDDFFDEGDVSSGHDTISGGAGEDRVDYHQRSGNLSVSLDDVANDGEAGEQDNVGSDVEDVSGGSGNDTLTGSAGDNKLDGNAGNDTLTGGLGSDELTGGPGVDALDGGGGDDILEEGNDGGACVCGAGNDIAIWCVSPAMDCEVR